MCYNISTYLYQKHSSQYSNVLCKFIQSFVFGGLLNRDDAYDSIQEHGVNKGLPWATGIPLDESSPCPNIVRLTENKQNFSFPVEYGDSE